MINFIVDNRIKNIKQKAYAIYYLTKAVKEEIKIGYEVKEEALNVFYGLKPTVKGSIYIPYFEVEDINKNYICRYENFSYINFEKDIEKYFSEKDGVLSFEFDIISTAFYLISCKEEYDIDKRDELNRFLAQYSLRRNLYNEAIFDNLSRMLLNVVKEIKHDLALKDDKFKIVLTHDVDNITSRSLYVFLHFAKEFLLGNKSFTTRLKDLISYTVFNKYMMIGQCIRLEEKYGAKSEFYFIQGKKGRLGARYGAKKLSKCKRFFSNKEGFVVGLHTNLYSYNNVELVKHEKKIVENCFEVSINSCRNHYLRFSIPESWNILYQAGIKYDTTLGYADVDGFRAATSRCFLPYDLNKNDKIDILEVPMINMDAVEMEKDKSLEEKWDSIKKVIDEVKKNKGTSSILWHQCSLSDVDYYNMYERALKYIASMGGKFITSKDLEEERSIEIRELDKIFNELEIKTN